MKTDKIIHKGDMGLPLIECIDTRLQRYLIRAFVLEKSNEDGEVRGILFRQFEYDYKPSLEEVVAGIIEAMPEEPITLTEIAQMAEQLGEDPIEPMRTALLHNITTYDTSPAVNSFTLGGKELWLPKETRVGLVNSITIEKAAGKETTVLWFGGEKYELSVDTALQMLSALEIYAVECFQNTARHIAKVNSTDNIDELVSYNYKYGYPLVLNFDNV